MRRKIRKAPLWARLMEHVVTIYAIYYFGEVYLSVALNSGG